jgi:D-alanine-D-alanine ligase
VDTHKKIIALVAGGFSGEYEISIQSAAVISENINPDKYEVFKIIITQEKWFEEKTKAEVDKNDFSITIEGRKIRFDLVFVGIHGTPGEDGKLQGYFDMVNVKYTSCNAVVSALSFNKIFCNRVVEFSDVAVAKSVHLFKNRSYTAAEILNRVSLPAFVKPAEGGSSLATFKIKQAEELLPAIEKAFEVDPQVMVEEFISGRELTQGAYVENDELVVLPITEIVCHKEFFDYEAKYTPGMTDEITPAKIDQSLHDRISVISKKLYQDLYCRGIVRFDYIYDDEQDIIYFLEVNTMPGQSKASIVPQQVRASGRTLREFYDNLISHSLLNH